MGCTNTKHVDVPVQAHIVKKSGIADSKRRVKINKDSKFQWKDSRGWNNYDGSADAKLKNAFMIGHGRAKFTLKNKQGEWEPYSFIFKNGTMTQKNTKTSTVRSMRPPPGMVAPRDSMLPQCEMMFVTLDKKQAGKSTIQVTHPKTREQITVAIPTKAKAGQRIAVPIPSAGESIHDVASRQLQHTERMSNGAKGAVGLGIVATAGAGVVGGVILGDHLAGGVMTETIAGVAVDIGDFAVDAGEDIADFAVDAGEAIGDWAEDVGDWLGDAGEDAGDWVCSIFD